MNRSSTPDPAGLRAEPDISVVIAAYNGAGTILECLNSVEHATAGYSREIIVVESSGDDTAEIVRQRFPGVVLIRSAERLSAGAARNRGFLAARGRIVFVTDQDCVVPATWVKSLARYFQDPTVSAAGGSVGVWNHGNLSGFALYFLEFLTHFPTSGPSRRNSTFLIGCNSAYRADVLRVVAFPDQTLGEDVLFSNELRKRGFNLVYDPAVEVRHQNREGWTEFFRYNCEMGSKAAAYHQVLRRWWVAPFLRMPAFAFLAPAVILPSIAVRLARARVSYFLRFLLLSPMCLLGNLGWAWSFRQRVLADRASESGFELVTAQPDPLRSSGPIRRRA